MQTKLGLLLDQRSSRFYRMGVKHNNSFKEVDMVADGQWSPKNVYVLRYFSDILILSVEGVLGKELNINLGLHCDSITTSGPH